jgi:hypothetical protein
MADDERQSDNPETAADGEPATGFPEPALEDDQDRSRDPGPHHALNNPVGEPDPTEWPDPYESRDDPRGPENGGAQAGDTSNSEPHPSHDPEADRSEAPERDRLDD